MKIKIILTVLLANSMFIHSMEEIEPKKQYLQEALITFPSLQLLAAWQTAIADRAIPKEQAPEEVLEFINKVKDVQASDGSLERESALFLNLLNNPDLDIEKSFPDLVKKYINEKRNEKFSNKYQFLNLVLFKTLDIGEPAFTKRKLIHYVRLILNTYVDVNAKSKYFDNFLYTPLTLSARVGHEEIVKMLIDKGINVNMADGIGKTPLICAIKNANNTTVAMLLQAGADINTQDTQDKNGKTALLLAASCLYSSFSKYIDGRYEKITKTLLDNNANVHMQDNGGNTALMYAVHNSNKKIIKKLIARGADVNCCNEGSYSALMLAAITSKHVCIPSNDLHEKIVKILLNAGANINAKDNLGRTALMFAESAGDKKVIQLLKEAEDKSKAV